MNTKKTLTTIVSLLVIVGVFSAQAVAHGGGHRGHGWGKAKHTQWRASLTAPGATGAVARTSHHGYGTTGPTGGVTTGLRGKFVYAQSSKSYVWGLKIKGLAASTAYTVTVAEAPATTAAKKKAKASHHSGATEPTGPVGSGPLPATVTTNADGWVSAAGKGARSDFGLDKTKAYVVTITDSAGAAVLKGTLLRKTHHAHRGCSGFSTTGNVAKKKRHNR